MLDENTMQWLERRKIGMCCRCENYEDCQWIPQPRGHFLTTQCFRFKSADGYCIDKNDYRDAAEFEARVAAKLAMRVMCHHCPVFRPCTKRCDWERLKYARITVEAEMEAESAGR